MIKEDQVILVDEKDNATGVMEKLEAHQRGLLHRAFSIFIFNSSKELVLQRRALHKYHSAGLWTNSCCSHPRPGEDIINAANRRLNEEMGIQCQLIPAFSFIYKVSFDNGLIEHEYDHVIIGQSNSQPVINKEEASDWKYRSLMDIKKDITLHPENYTEWFKISYERVFDYLKAI